MTLIQAYKLLCQSITPEDVFGALNGSGVEKRYRELALVCHPDRYLKSRDRTLADEAFKALGGWLARAEKKIQDGTYGDRKAIDAEITVATKKNTYTITHRIKSGDVAEVYGAHDKPGFGVVLKVGRTPANNDLMSNEATVLKWLAEEAPTRKLKVRQHIPELLDSFEIQTNKKKTRVNVFAEAAHFWTLADIRREYPEGLDPRDAVWMINRLLGALVCAHQAGVIHGAITLDHVLVCPTTHNGLLIDWCYAVKNGPIKAISPKYRPYYPPEVFAKKPATKATDLYMAACCFLAMLGGDPATKTFPSGTPVSLRGLLRACWLGQGKRTSDAFELYEDLAKLFGPRKFRPFTMPRVAA